MREPYWWYVLYVKANKEHRVVADIAQYYKMNRVRNYELVPFCPECEHYYRNSKNKTHGACYLKRPMFPNYVFIETDMPSAIFLEAFSQFVYNSDNIVRVLHYGDSPEIALSLEERCRFEYLLKEKRCIEHSVGYVEGERIYITGGSLIGMEGTIKRINRHNRSADIEVKMFNTVTDVKVALEIIKKA